MNTVDYLRVDGENLIDTKGKTVILRGVSLFWSQWMGKYYNASLVSWLVKDWKINVVRLAIAVDQGGYLHNPRCEYSKLEECIQAAINNNIYVIIDWHTHNRYPDEARKFFCQLAIDYGKFPNVIFELWNEPASHYNWQHDIRPYHYQLINSIRRSASDTLLILGTEKHCSMLDMAIEQPIDKENIVYSLHFYAASHKDKFRQHVLNALEGRLPVFVSEYGSCEADGDGIVDAVETVKWWHLLNKYKVSYVCWAISDKREAASLLRPGANPQGHWAPDELSHFGHLLRQHLRSFSTADKQFPNVNYQ